MTDHNPMDFVVEPSQSVARGLAYGEKLQQGGGIKFGIPEVDEKLLPLLPGWLEFIVARPGDGKTSLLTWRAMSAIKNLKDDEVVLFFSWEQFREEIELSMLVPGTGQSVSDIYWGQADMEAIAKSNAAARSADPIWIVAPSFYTEKTKKTNMLYIEDLYAIARGLEGEWGLKPGLILIDYLQYIPVQSGRNRTEEIGENVYGLKQLGIDLNCPISVAAQASRRKGAKHATLIPTLDDIYWTSEAGQAAYRVIGSVRPIKYVKEDTHLDFANQSFYAHRNLFFLGMSKQRGEEGFAEFGLYFDISTMTMGSWYDQPKPGSEQKQEYEPNGRLW